MAHPGDDEAQRATERQLAADVPHLTDAPPFTEDNETEVSMSSGLPGAATVVEAADNKAVEPVAPFSNDWVADVPAAAPPPQQARHGNSHHQHCVVCGQQTKLRLMVDGQPALHYCVQHAADVPDHKVCANGHHIRPVSAFVEGFQSCNECRAKAARRKAERDRRKACYEQVVLVGFAADDTLVFYPGEVSVMNGQDQAPFHITFCATGHVCPLAQAGNTRKLSLASLREDDAARAQLNTLRAPDAQPVDAQLWSAANVLCGSVRFVWQPHLVAAPSGSAVPITRERDLPMLFPAAKRQAPDPSTGTLSPFTQFLHELAAECLDADIDVGIALDCMVAATGETLLMAAVLTADEELAETLLDMGAHPCIYANGTTAVLLAEELRDVSLQHERMFELLSAEAEDLEGMLAIHLLPADLSDAQRTIMARLCGRELSKRDFVHPVKSADELLKTKVPPPETDTGAETTPAEVSVPERIASADAIMPPSVWAKHEATYADVLESDITPRVLVVGKTGSGKSSVIAKLIHPNRELTEAETKEFAIEHHDSASTRLEPFIAGSSLQLVDSLGWCDGRSVDRAAMAVKDTVTRLNSKIFAVMMVSSCADRAMDAVQQSVIMSIAESCMEDGQLTVTFWNRFVFVFTRARSLAVPRGPEPFAVRWARSRELHEANFRNYLSLAIVERMHVPDDDAAAMANSVRVVFVENLEGLESGAGWQSFTDAEGWNILPDGARCHEQLFVSLCEAIRAAEAPIRLARHIHTLETEIQRMRAEAAANARRTWEAETQRKVAEAAANARRTWEAETQRKVAEARIRELERERQQRLNEQQVAYMQHHHRSAAAGGCAIM